jgi:hypothetical protein
MNGLRLVLSVGSPGPWGISADTYSRSKTYRMIPSYKPRQMEARDVAVIVEPAGLSLNRTVEFPPYHYGAIFRERRGKE